MGSVIAKLDSNDKILDIKSEGKKLSQEEILKLKNYYNKHGVIKVRLDMDQMDIFIQSYLKKLSKTSQKLEVAVKQNMRMSVGLGLMVISNNGFIMIADNDKFKSVEGFNGIEGFAEVNEENTVPEESDEMVDTFVKKPSRPEFDISSYRKPKSRTEAETIAESEMMPREERRAKSEMMSRDKRRAKSEIKAEIKAKIEAEAKAEMKPLQEVIGENRIVAKPAVQIETAPKMDVANVPFMEVIIPKILLTSERIEFINFISRLFAEDPKTKIVYSSFKQILEGVMTGSNSEIKIANLIGLSMRVAIMAGIASEAKKLGPNNFTEDDMINFTTQVVADFMTDFPSDKCSFYSDKMNFIKFTPNICNVKKDNKSIQEACPKCQECKESKCHCPEVKCPDVKCPEMKCPAVVLPEMKFPKMVLPEMKCPPVVLSEMRCPPVVIPEIKSPNVNIPEIKCPKVTIPEMKCPNVTVTEQSSMWKVTTIIFVLLVIGLIVMMIMNKDGNESVSLSKITNLAKLK